ncbi:reverse transcriptase zinc-binding domain-containing protein [Artemisia annua]|uniref:Reverse transcriptase zinc-binding domain-containing protein n=1 Tax=Artemisia annua TaxID=35608 RepID=A0A2U1MQM3_ARTAN|nr:reverse transcriptase zinc-binding domain-containing protein [Artemisia annua]
MKCCFCKLQKDSHSHLFFQCTYARRLWERLKGVSKLDDASYIWVEVISGFANKPAKNTIWSVIQSKEIGAFGDSSRSEEELFRVIVDSVRLRIMGLKIMVTSDVIRASKIWNFPIDKMAKYKLIVEEVSCTDWRNISSTGMWECNRIFMVDLWFKGVKDGGLSRFSVNLALTHVMNSLDDYHGHILIGSFCITWWDNYHGHRIIVQSVIWCGYVAQTTIRITCVELSKYTLGYGIVCYLWSWGFLECVICYSNTNKPCTLFPRTKFSHRVFIRQGFLMRQGIRVIGYCDAHPRSFTATNDMKFWITKEYYVSCYLENVCCNMKSDQNGNFHILSSSNSAYYGRSHMVMFGGTLVDSFVLFHVFRVCDLTIVEAACLLGLEVVGLFFGEFSVCYCFLVVMALLDICSILY